MSQEIAKVQSGALMQAEGVQRGFEGGVDREDLIIPRAKLMQALSPELTEGLEGIKVGSVINSLTKEVLPQEFIPIFMFKNYIRFNPRSKDDPNFDSEFDPGAVIWKSTDPLDPKVKAEARFGPNGEKPVATTFTEAVALCVPLVPNVQIVCAKPCASVVALRGATLPPPAVTANVTVCPLTGVPFASVNCTFSGCANAASADPV